MVRTKLQRRCAVRLRALVADILVVHPRLAALLHDFDLEFVATRRGLVAALEDRRFAFVLVGMDLNECQALDAVKEVRRRAPKTPVICVRAAPRRFRLEDGIAKCFKLACGEVGARGFLDFFAFPRDAEVRAAIFKLLCST